MRDISIVMPVLLRKDEHLIMTIKCISAARSKTNIPFEFIIVESGSQYLADEADIYVHEKTPTTPEIGHNLGFRLASRSKYVGLLTNDTFVTDGWLEALLEPHETLKDCGFSTLGALRFGHKAEPRIEEGNFFDIALIKSEIFDKCGYYDERFCGSWSDPDLLIRGYKLGYKMYRNFRSIVDGAEPHSTVGMNPLHQANYEMGRALFREKHEGCGLPIYEATK